MRRAGAAMRGLLARGRRALRFGRAAPPPESLLYVLPAIPARVPLPAGVAIAEVDAAAVRAAPERYAGTVLDATTSLTHGHRCFVATVDGRVAYRMWVGDAAAVRESYPVDALPNDALWVYAAYTLPEFRGRRLYPAAIGWLAARGRAVALQVTTDNVASQRAVTRAGGVHVATRAIF